MTQNEWTFYQRLKPFDEQGNPITLKQLAHRYYTLIALDRNAQGESFESIAYSLNYSRNGLAQLIKRTRNSLEEVHEHSDVY